MLICILVIGGRILILKRVLDCSKGVKNIEFEDKTIGMIFLNKIYPETDLHGVKCLKSVSAPLRIEEAVKFNILFKPYLFGEVKKVLN